VIKIKKEPSDEFIWTFKELLGYQDFFTLKKAKKLGSSVQISLTHIIKEDLSSLGSHQVLINKAHGNEFKIVKIISFDFNFKYSIMEYLTPTKITFVLYFKEIKIKKLKDLTLYTDFREVIESEFIASDFQIIQYKQTINAIQFKFKYPITLSDKLNPLFLRDRVSGFSFPRFPNVKNKFLLKYCKVQEIISENSLIFIYRFEIIKRRYSIFDFGICKNSKHLLIKYIKMLDSVPYYIFSNGGPHKKEYVYLEFKENYGVKTKTLKHLFNLIKNYDGNHPCIFLGKDKNKISENHLWIPRRSELVQIILKTDHEYNQWRIENKISIKCEELNLLAYLMYKKYDLIWDKKNNQWIHKPFPPRAIFRINKLLTLKLEDEQTNIYVKKKLFTHCKYLLLSFTRNETIDYEEINSIDEIKHKYDQSHENNHSKINPEVEFWGHCSNIQTWYENDYNTNILHSNLSFPLLKELVEHGDPKAKRVFKDEIALRFESNFRSVVLYLLKEKYLFYLDFNEIETLSANIDFSKWGRISIHEFLNQWHMIAIKTLDRENISQIAKRKKELLKKN